jgi:5-methylcytosine-specific restriction endonuclease McrA
MPRKDPDYHKHYYLRNRKRLLARKHTRYQADPQKIQAQEKAYKLRHAAKVKARNHAYNLANAEKLRAKNSAYSKAHPEKVKTWSQAHKARKRGASINNLSHAEWLAIQEAQDHRCAYCGKRCKGRLTQDHITPLSQGGAHTLHNVIGACQSCNSKKHVGPPLKPVQPLLLSSAPKKKKTPR